MTGLNLEFSSSDRLNRILDKNENDLSLVIVRDIFKLISVNIIHPARVAYAMGIVKDNWEILQNNGHLPIRWLTYPPHELTAGRLSFLAKWWGLNARCEYRGAGRGFVLVSCSDPRVNIKKVVLHPTQDDRAAVKDRIMELKDKGKTSREIERMIRGMRGAVKRTRICEIISLERARKG